MVHASTLAHAYTGLAQKHGVEQASDMFFSFVRKNHLDDVLVNVSRELARIAKKERMENTARITTSHAVPQSLLHTIKKHIGATEETLIEKSVDPHLLGGFQARLHHVLYDASLRRTLEELELHLKS